MSKWLRSAHLELKINIVNFVAIQYSNSRNFIKNNYLEANQEVLGV